jgi:hypothetical protein
MLTFPGWDDSRKAISSAMAGTPPPAKQSPFARAVGVLNERAAAKVKAMTPPPPVMPNSPIIDEAREKARKAAGLRTARTSTILTSNSGVLGDPPLDRPMARAATLLGAT